MAKIISVVNQKGGTGKSACAANLGVGLALMNKKVLVVDADPQSDVSAGFGFRDFFLEKSAFANVDSVTAIIVMKH